MRRPGSGRIADRALTYAGGSPAGYAQAFDGAAEFRAIQSGQWAGLPGVPPSTPDLVRSRYAPPQARSYIMLRPRTWTSVPVDRPTVLRSLTTLQQPCWAFPTKIPGIGDVQWQGTPGVSAINSAGTWGLPTRGRGNLYLPQPGTWWLWSDDANQLAPFAVIDASDPITALEVMSEAGTVAGLNARVALPSATNVLVRPLNVARRGLRLQFVDGGSAGAVLFQVGFSNSNVSAPTTWFFAPVAVSSVSQLLDWTGDLCTQRAVWALNPSATAGFVEYQESLH